MSRLSLRDLVLLTPRPFRKFVKNTVLPERLARKLSNVIDGKARSRIDSPGVGTSIARSTEVRRLIDRLYGGYSSTALGELEALKQRSAERPSEASDAARALGNWYLRRDIERAYENAVFARVSQPRCALKTAQVILETDCLFALGRSEEARELVSLALAANQENTSLLLTLANTFASQTGDTSASGDLERLRLINQVLTTHELSNISLIDASKPLAIDNICCPEAVTSVPVHLQPKISVIIAAFKAADTLHIAIDCLSRQTWKNLEIIIVDDVSPDQTFEVAKSFAEKDPRIVVLRQETNGGPYPCRNLALKHATGEFITVHDSDDWSHPQKLELQAKHLMKSRAAANVTDWVRCLPHLFFRGTTRGGDSRVALNHSALMIRREVALALGGWDPVRIAADTEFIRRLEKLTKTESISRVKKDVPLAFALDLPDSLTRSSVTHVLTKFHGVRRNYQEAATFYRRNFASANNFRLPTDGTRAFPVPRLMLPSRPGPMATDLLVIMDFALGGGAYVSTMNYIKAALAAGLTVSVFHYRRYDLDVLMAPSAELLALAHHEKVYRVSPGEQVVAETVLVGYPVILSHRLDLFPEIRCRRMGIITNQMHARLYSGGDVQYDPLQVAAYAEEVSGQKPLWIPISDLVRNLMLADGRYHRISTQTWNPLIEAAKWTAGRIPFRGDHRKRPVVGRHSRDHYTKWPTDPDAIRAAYCADRACEVRLLGGARIPRQILGRVPRNWKVYPFGSRDTSEFLQELDFYVHYPHEDYIEEFGRAVIEAMALGIVVILPRVFEPTFGSAALYAEPAEVFPLIEAIWKSPKRWQERSEAGVEFVKQNNDWSKLPSRLRALEDESGE